MNNEYTVMDNIGQCSECGDWVDWRYMSSINIGVCLLCSRKRPKNRRKNKSS